LIAGKGDHGLKHWVREHRIDAVIGHSDQVFEFLRAVGPDRLAFASLCTDGTDDRCSGLVDPGRRLGQRSVDLVDQLLRRGEFGLSAERTTHAVAATWMDGKSLPHSSLVEETAPMVNRARLLAVS
jgi:hypothetical protein